MTKSRENRIARKAQDLAAKNFDRAILAVAESTSDTILALVVSIALYTCAGLFSL